MRTTLIFSTEEKMRGDCRPFALCACVSSPGWARCLAELHPAASELAPAGCTLYFEQSLRSHEAWLTQNHGWPLLSLAVREHGRVSSRQLVFSTVVFEHSDVFHIMAVLVLFINKKKIIPRINKYNGEEKERNKK